MNLNLFRQRALFECLAKSRRCRCAGCSNGSLGCARDDSSNFGYALLFSVLLLPVVLFFGPGCDGTREEVVLYCSVDQAFAEPLVGEFEKQTGIEVLARYDTEATKTVGLVKKIEAEAARPIADVFWSSEVFYTIRLAREGLLEGFESEETRGWPGYLTDEGGHWYGFALRGRVIAYSSERVSDAEAPKRLEDLLDGRWKGRLVMADPGSGTTGGDVASWFVHYGADGAREILQGLKANQVRLVDGNSTAVRWVATGQADVCLTDTDDVYAGQRNGWPISRNFLDQGGAGVLAIPNTAALIKGAPHREAARKLMDYLLSERVERLLAQSDSHNAPIHGSLAEEFEEYLIPTPLEVNYAEVAEVLPEAIQAAREILK